MSLILNKDEMISIVAHMFSKNAHATLAGVDDTLLFSR